MRSPPPFPRFIDIGPTDEPEPKSARSGLSVIAIVLSALLVLIALVMIMVPDNPVAHSLWLLTLVMASIALVQECRS